MDRIKLFSPSVRGLINLNDHDKQQLLVLESNARTYRTQIKSLLRELNRVEPADRRLAAPILSQIDALEEQPSIQALNNFRINEAELYMDLVISDPSKAKLLQDFVDKLKNRRWFRLYETWKRLYLTENQREQCRSLPLNPDLTQIIVNRVRSGDPELMEEAAKMLREILHPPAAVPGDAGQGYLTRPRRPRLNVPMWQMFPVRSSPSVHESDVHELLKIPPEDSNYPGTGWVCIGMKQPAEGTRCQPERIDDLGESRNFYIKIEFLKNDSYVRDYLQEVNPELKKLANSAWDQSAANNEVVRLVREAAMSPAERRKKEDKIQANEFYLLTDMMWIVCPEVDCFEAFTYFDKERSGHSRRDDGRQHTIKRFITHFTETKHYPEASTRERRTHHNGRKALVCNKCWRIAAQTYMELDEHKRSCSIHISEIILSNPCRWKNLLTIAVDPNCWTGRATRSFADRAGGQFFRHLCSLGK
ncbi:hypothetical protein T439DRAFT_48166 [Meredithblackwellia eburnea MCA 4105]